MNLLARPFQFLEFTVLTNGCRRGQYWIDHYSPVGRRGAGGCGGENVILFSLLLLEQAFDWGARILSYLFSNPFSFGNLAFLPSFLDCRSFILVCDLRFYPLVFVRLSCRSWVFLFLLFLGTRSFATRCLLNTNTKLHSPNKTIIFTIWAHSFWVNPKLHIVCFSFFKAKSLNLFFSIYKYFHYHFLKLSHCPYFSPIIWS